MTGLTDLQRRVLAYIHAYRWAKGRPPGWRDVGAAFGWTSPHNVTQHVAALRRKGALHPAPRDLARTLVPAGFLLVTAAGTVLPCTDAEVAGLIGRGRAPTRDGGAT